MWRAVVRGVGGGGHARRAPTGVGAPSARTVTGSISGSIVDPSESGRCPAPTPVALVDEATGQHAMSATTTQRHRRVRVARGETRHLYGAESRSPGFSPLERRNTVLPAGETLTLGLSLTVGGVSETITLTAQGSLVQAQSSNRSALLTASQMELLGARGRDVVSMFRPARRVLPAGSGCSRRRLRHHHAEHRRRHPQHDELDDRQRADEQRPRQPADLQQHHQPRRHRREHRRVEQLSRRARAQRRRSRQHRHQIGDARLQGDSVLVSASRAVQRQRFFNNKNGVNHDPLYRYSTQGIAAGGGGAEAGRSELFFFYSFEDHNTLTPQPLRTVMVPTEARAQQALLAEP